MYAEATVREVFRLRAEGTDCRAIARISGVSYTQVRRWVARGLDAVLESPMRRSSVPHDDSSCTARGAANHEAYAYLLGQYLGDGTIVRVGRCERLEIVTTATYPGIRAEVHAAITAVLGRPGNERGSRDGAVVVTSYSTHWPCLLPQHGPGRKHLRPIVLEPWQEVIALDEHPKALLRGLIHSDGCRNLNFAITRGKRYEYTRYSFSNRSNDIHAIFQEACNRLGIAWRRSYKWTTSVSTRESVALLDEFIGPKY